MVSDTSVVPNLEPLERLRAELAGVEEKVVMGYSLADAMREGSGVTTQRVVGFIGGATACGLGAAWLAAKARGYVPDQT